MTKIKKISPAKIRRIQGGKDASRLVEEFLARRGFDASECLQQRSSDIASWSIPLSDDEELEISIEGLSRPPETTLYMGINIMAVSVQNSSQQLAAALTVADTLIGAKISLVNYDLVLSVTIYTSNMRPDELDYIYELIMMQKLSVQDAIEEELERT